MKKEEAKIFSEKKNAMEKELRELNQAVIDAGYDKELFKHYFMSERLKRSKKYYYTDDNGGIQPTKLMKRLQSHDFFFADNAVSFLIRISSSGVRIKNIPDEVLVNIMYMSYPLICADVAMELFARAGFPKFSDETEVLKAADLLIETNRQTHMNEVKKRQEKQKAEWAYFDSVDSKEKAADVLIGRASIMTLDKLYQRGDFQTLVSLFRLCDLQRVRSSDRNLPLTALLTDFKEKNPFETVLRFLIRSTYGLEPKKRNVLYEFVGEGARHHSKKMWLSVADSICNTLGKSTYGDEFFDWYDDYYDDEMELCYDNMYTSLIKIPLLEHGISRRDRIRTALEDNASDPLVCTFEQLKNYKSGVSDASEL